MRVHVFLGPTLAPDTAHEIAGHVGIELEVHPPARCGDLVRLLDSESLPRNSLASLVLLVDGVYERVPALWHKEIIAVLAAGGRVIGCSSMGALRAVECAPWGAQPTGLIAEEYSNGVRTSDADVAVAHAGQEDGYRALSVPLVDVDAASDLARERGILDSQQAADLRAKARAMFYARRTWPRMLDTLDPRAAHRLHEEIIALPGRKEQDARDTFAKLDQLLSQPAERQHDPAAVLPTQQFDVLRAERPFSQDAELLHQLEQRPDWPELLRAGLIRALLADGAIAGLPRPSAQEAVIALAEQLRLPPENAAVLLAEAWGITPARAVQLGREQLQLAHLWARHGSRARAHVIDHLRITGRYPAVDGGEEEPR